MFVAGVLIIWDRMFGTFAEEEEEVVYGLTHNVNAFNAWTVQTHHLLHVFRQFFAIKGFGNKMKTLFYGPGWNIGKPRLGDPNDIPDVHAPVKKHQSPIPFNLKALSAAFFMHLVFVGYNFLDQTTSSKVGLGLHPSLQLPIFAYLLAGILCGGIIFDCHPSAPFCFYAFSLSTCLGHGYMYWTSSLLLSSLFPMFDDAVLVCFIPC